MLRRFILLAFLLLTVPAIAQDEPSVADASSFPAFIDSIRSDAQSSGIGSRGLQALSYASFEPSIIRLDRKQPESKLTFAQYAKSTLTAARIQRGQALAGENAAVLQQVSRYYGVPARIIVALWGKETDFGRNTGGENVIAALATLAYEGRRADFFKSELLQALRIVDQGHVEASAMQGSWAGAMGQCQFMPSSFFKYAVDGDGDGRIDIWGDTTDVFASTANYLHTEGWNPAQPWGMEVAAPPNLNPAVVGKEHSYSYADWARAGVMLASGQSLPNGQGLVSLIQPDGPSGRSFLITDNFRVLLHWNKSSYFAASVGLLADAIGNQSGD